MSHHFGYGSQRAYIGFRTPALLSMGAPREFCSMATIETVSLEVARIKLDTLVEFVRMATISPQKALALTPGFGCRNCFSGCR